MILDFINMLSKIMFVFLQFKCVSTLVPPAVIPSDLFFDIDV